MKLNDYQQSLVESCMWLPETMAHQFNRKDYNDLVGEGYIGLCVAALKYDPEKGVKFDTYAYYWVRGYMTAYIRKNPLSDLSFDEVLALDDECLFNNEPVNAEDEAIKQYDISLMLSAIKTVLSERERDVIERMYGINGKKEEKTSEIARSYGFSVQNINLIKKSALQKLRKYIGGNVYENE